MVYDERDDELEGCRFRFYFSKGKKSLAKSISEYIFIFIYIHWHHWLSFVRLDNCRLCITPMMACDIIVIC